jgi:hypothetical protein
MSQIEINFLLEKMESSNYYVEFGAGYSTLLASKYKDLRIISFESDEKYCKFIQNHISVGSDNQNVTIIHVDIGPVGHWGYPKTGTTEFLFPNYLWTPTRTLMIKKIKPDLILIDGRFRVATFLNFLINYPGTRIIFDDYFDRIQYHIVEEIIMPAAKVGRMAFFKSPKRMRRSAILNSIKLIQEYIADPN